MQNYRAVNRHTVFGTSMSASGLTITQSGGENGYYLRCTGGQYGVPHGVNVGNHSSIQDLFAQGTDLTLEYWGRIYDVSPFGYSGVWTKMAAWQQDGWEIMEPSRLVFWRLLSVWSNAVNNLSQIVGSRQPLNTWFHWAACWQNSSGQLFGYTNGIRGSASMPNGTYISDVGADMKFLADEAGQHGAFDIAWARISNVQRYWIGGPTPPALDSPPAVDANTIEQWNFNEGSGTSTAAEVNSANDGTIVDPNYLVWQAL